MAFYRQSEACPKFGTAQGGGASSGAAYGRDQYPVSRAVYGPAEITPQTEATTQWSPFSFTVAQPYRGGWDALGGRLMHVPQADTFFVGDNPWPANGVDDQPNVLYSLLRLDPHTSAHPGFTLPMNAPGPAMVFNPPPVFGLQTQPIFAFGV